MLVSVYQLEFLAIIPKNEDEFQAYIEKLCGQNLETLFSARFIQPKFFQFQEKYYKYK